MPECLVIKQKFITFAFEKELLDRIIEFQKNIDAIEELLK